MLTPFTSVIFGGDPELFLKDVLGNVVGSEKVIPKDGLKYNGTSHVVRDGVQVELNPPSAPNAIGFGRNVARAFSLLDEHLKKIPTVTYDFRGTIEVGINELNSLSDDTRMLGCKPSFNIYGDRPITVDPLTYTKRSAGGHIHMSISGSQVYSGYPNGSYDNRRRLVSLFDIFVGNSCVMFDRDPGAAERRENYGRAGEFRLPNYGIEYRTVSNFWLRSPIFMDFVIGMCRLSISILDQSLNNRDQLEDELIEIVNIDNFIKAIDTNNADLARYNFDTIKPFLTKHLPETGFPLNPNNLNYVPYFGELITKYGIGGLFGENPVENWLKFDDTYVPFEKYASKSNF